MARLTAAIIVDAATQLVEQDGAEALTVRRLGQQLQADPTAIYRHFFNMQAILAAVGDRLLGDVISQDMAAVAGDRIDNQQWRAVVVEACVRLRHANLARPALASLVRSGPSLRDNETAITEYLLSALLGAGLSIDAASSGYHALIELTIGSAAIDARIDGLTPTERSKVYDEWRRHYAALDATACPASSRAANSLYRGSADQRFDDALGLMLDGLEARLERAAPRE